MSKQEKNAKILKGLIAVGLVLLALEAAWLLFVLPGAKEAVGNNDPTTRETMLQEETAESAETEEVALMPWEENNTKRPEDYTWEEYDALTGEQQKAFRDHLGDDFATWLDSVREDAEINPWDEPGAKQPEAYSWEEYEVLSASQQIAFQKHLGEKGFEDWQSKVQEELETYPWEMPGAKQPKDYTWEEFEALTATQQMAFQKYLGEKEFEDWLNKVQEKPAAENPWEKPGAKKPKDYTWAEFETLTADQQMAFQDYLGEVGFEEWLKKIQLETGKHPWELPGAKKPKEYTWAEYETLTAAQQMAFQQYLGEKGFEEWLNKVQNQSDQGGENPWEKHGAKQPKDYTWAEFEALTAAQQMAFQDYLGEAGFEKWLNKVQNQTEMNPWEVPGAKKPEDYTWEEFEALTGAQQMAFQDYLGEEGFAAWLNCVQG